jgi:glutathione S-transferase
MSAYALTALLTVLALLLTQGTAMAVGSARVRYDVKPPCMNGPDGFVRALRVQQNTLEQVVVFLPALWLAALFGNRAAASLFGGLWVLGRVAYAVGYLRAAEQRAIGFLLGLLASTALLVMALVGTVSQLF